MLEPTVQPGDHPSSKAVDDFLGSGSVALRWDIQFKNDMRIRPPREKSLDNLPCSRSGKRIRTFIADQVGKGDRVTRRVFVGGRNVQLPFIENPFNGCQFSETNSRLQARKVYPGLRIGLRTPGL